MQQPPGPAQDGGAAASAGSDRPIFIVGCPRSGTTLLQLMLSAHPRIAIPPENRFLLPAYEQRADFGDLRRPERRLALADWIARQPQSSDLQITPEVLREQIAAGPPTLGSAIGIVFREYASRFGKPRWGDKRPLYLHHIPTILRLFPDAQIVHIIRDGRDCVASLQQMPWWHADSMAAISRWVQSMRIATSLRASLRTDQYHELQYEHLVAEPGPVLRQLCTFIGESFSEAMLEPRLLAGDAVPKAKVWHSRTSQSVSSAAVNQWVGQLEPWEVAVTQTLGRRPMQRYGYERSATAGRAPADKLLRVARHLAQREVLAGVARVRDQVAARRYGMPVAAQLTSQQLQLAAASGEQQWANSAAPAAGGP